MGLKNGKNKIIETNFRNFGTAGNGNGTDGQQEDSVNKNEKTKQTKDWPQVENRNGSTTTGSHLPTMKIAIESRLTKTMDKTSKCHDYVLFEFVCFMFQFCSFLATPI